MMLKKSHSPQPHPRDFLPFRLLLAMVLLLGVAQSPAGTLWLDTLDLKTLSQSFGEAKANQSYAGTPLSINGKRFERGIGSHVESEWSLKLNGDADKLLVTVGLDDSAENKCRGARFSVVGDGKKLWTSPFFGLKKKGEPTLLEPITQAVDLRGVKDLLLTAEAIWTTEYGYVDWADARIEYHGAKPVPIPRAFEPAVVLTPPVPKTPRINGARIFGVQPGHPCFFTIAATGDRPMKFAAEGLPPELQLDETSGQITGELSKKGEYLVTLQAANALGSAKRKLRIVCGDQIALTPPMGWNSWNCFAGEVTQEKVVAAAEAMVSSGLAQHGWTYVNIDDFWQKSEENKNDPSLGGIGRDAAGKIVPNLRFPDMKALCVLVHSRGLKLGIYSSPGPRTCGQCTGSFNHEVLDAQSYGQWGVDYLKYDLCTYKPEMEAKRTIKPDLSGFANLANASSDKQRNAMVPYAVMRTALNLVPRDIVYSFCQYGKEDVWQWGESLGGNCWRTTGDIVDTWNSMSGIGFRQAGHEGYAKPGHWNDLDILVIGQVGWGQPRPSTLTPNEQYTHMSLWCLLCSPLLIGCDMTQMSSFTLGLLSNDEVIEVNQDPLGCQATRVFQQGDMEVWAKSMEDGSKVVGLFNRGRNPVKIAAKWSDLKIAGPQMVRDLWKQTDLGTYKDQFEAEIPRHGVALVRIRPGSSQN